MLLGLGLTTFARSDNLLGTQTWLATTLFITYPRLSKMCLFILQSLWLSSSGEPEPEGTGEPEPEGTGEPEPEGTGEPEGEPEGGATSKFYGTGYIRVHHVSIKVKV